MATAEPRRWRDPVDFYATHAARFDAERSRTLFEQDWLDAFLALIPAGGMVLDLGCGMGEPNAAYIWSAASGSQAWTRRAPCSTWPGRGCRLRSGSRRTCADSISGAGSTASSPGTASSISTWTPSAPVSRPLPPMPCRAPCSCSPAGDAGGERVNPCFGEPLYHASLAPEEYRACLAAHGFEVVRHVEADPACGERTIWLAKTA